MKNESVIMSTVVLITANAISKILGAVLKIPLTYILGEEGMAVYHTAFSVYAMLLSFVLSGMPFALSKCITEELAAGNRGNIRFAVRFTMLFMTASGAVLSAIMYFGADFFAFSLKDPKAALAVKAISPAVLLVAIGAVYKSCYEGYAHMIPTAVSQVSEAFFKLIVGYILAAWFIPFSVGVASAAAIFGITSGEAFATFLLFLMYIPYRRDTYGLKRETPARSIVKRILRVAVPMTLTSVIIGSLSLLEASVVRGALTAVRFTEKSASDFFDIYSGFTPLFDTLPDTKKLSLDGARWLYGAYSGYAGTVVNLPIGILAAFTAAILPAVMRKLALGSFNELGQCIASSSKILLACSLPCAVILSACSRQILSLLFNNMASSGMLAAVSPCLVIAVLNRLLVSVLYASGKIAAPFLTDIFALALKTVLSYTLIRIPELNIYGMIYAGLCADLLRLVLNYSCALKLPWFKFAEFSDTVKIFLSGALMYVFNVKTRSSVYGLCGGGAVGLFVNVTSSLMLYLCLCVLTGALKKEDITHLSH